MSAKRVFIEHKAEYRQDAKRVLGDITAFLGVPAAGVRLFYGYEITGIMDSEFDRCAAVVFDLADTLLYTKLPPELDKDFVFGCANLPGQLDERGTMMKELIRVVFPCDEDITVQSFDIYAVSGNLSKSDKEKIINYYINPTDAYMFSPDEPLRAQTPEKPAEAEPVNAFINPPEDDSEAYPQTRAVSTYTFKGFIDKTKDELIAMHKQLGLSMNINDFMFIHAYYKEDENRDPTETEIRIFDTYWSDHCRHITFLTHIDSVAFEDGPYNGLFKQAYDMYIEKRKEIGNENHICLMDLATMGMKVLKAEGKLQGLDESEEVNACSVHIKVDTDDGGEEDWLLMFKNETHNHPTEIEPFGGAATCLGGAIRDPLAGRAYVYQAMRVTGSADPRTAYDNTIPGKLPQRKITQTAAKGYSSYGNAIGVPAGLVNEIYHDGYFAKRMELGAVVGAVKKENVIRHIPQPGDVVLLVGGRTGRDGIGAATGSSKTQEKDAILTCGAQVQKGNPYIERNIMRLFRRAQAARLIKRCNDFGAGGVSVAIGELADGLDIMLDDIPVKYPGLSATELAISESQERMAVVVSKDDEKAFTALANEENLECTLIAVVTSEKRLVMRYGGEVVCDISRAFLNTSGTSCSEAAGVLVVSPKKRETPAVDDAAYLLPVLSDINVAAQKGLIEEFACGGAVLAPLGGIGQFTPIQAMAAKIPVPDGETNTASVMAYGYDPYLSDLSPFHGAVCAIVDSITKVIAAGADSGDIYLSFQEYFERLGNNSAKWGKPFAALLGAFYTQMKLGIASIGGKDSMSGSCDDINVPPALVSFAISTANASDIISPEFKAAHNEIAYLETPVTSDGIPDLSIFLINIQKIERLIKQKKILSAYALGTGGIAAAAAKMSFGNFIGAHIDAPDLYGKKYGSFLVEVLPGTSAAESLTQIGETTEGYDLVINRQKTELPAALASYLASLEDIFPTGYFDKHNEQDYTLPEYKANERFGAKVKSAAPPEVFIPVLPGANGDYDIKSAFEKNGGSASMFVIKTQNGADYAASLYLAAKKIKESRILAVPAGGHYRQISAFLRNDIIKDAIDWLLTENDGLIIGIADGFTALLHAGLISDTLWQKPDIAFTHNTVGRYVSAFARVKVISDKSPWFAGAGIGEPFTIPVSTGAGRLIAGNDIIAAYAKNGQIAIQCIDLLNEPSADIRYNPTGSAYGICAMTDITGRILGITGRADLAGDNIHKNIPGNKDIKIFESGVKYFK